MIIRLATKKDKEAMAQLRWDFVNTVSKYDPKEKEEFLKRFGAYLDAVLNQSYIALCAYDKDKLVGNIYVGLLFKPLVPGKDPVKIGYLTNLMVRSSHRNSGVGKNLMQHLFAWANNNNVESMFVCPEKGAEDFYKKHGFDTDDGILRVSS